jgi:hypothetical protein
MSNEDVKNEVLIDESQDAETSEVVETTDELVETEVEDEGVVEDTEEVVEAKAKVKEEEEDEDEDESDDEGDKPEEEEEEEPVEVSVPKTKAGVINAAVEMLKKAKKVEAQAIFKKMVTNEGVEVVEATEEDEGTDVSHIEYSEDLDALVSEEATLSDGFRDKAGIVFEAALQSKVSAEIDRLESEYAQNLEEEVTELQTSLVEKVDNYLSYVVENWMKENEVAVSTGLRTEIAEDFMTSLQTVFKEHYIEVPEGKADLIDDLADQVTELEEALNKSTEENISLHASTQSFERAEVVREQSLGLADTEAEKLASLVEAIDFEDKDTFEMKVKTVKESYFTSVTEEAESEVDAAIGNDDTAPVELSDAMSRYTQAITKSNN